MDWAPMGFGPSSVLNSCKRPQRRKIEEKEVKHLGHGQAKIGAGVAVAVAVAVAVVVVVVVVFRKCLSTMAKSSALVITPSGQAPVGKLLALAL